MPPVFRYFELVDEATGKFAFWEIAIDGPALEQRQGPVGTAGKHERETCSSIEHARHEYDLRVEAKLVAGYRECADRRLDARTRALEAAIESDPDDLAAYMVYADWIQTLGDLRGGLIVAQIAVAEGERGAAARANAYLQQHAAMFLGPLADHVGYDGALIEPTWRYGFIRRARVRVRDVWSGDSARLLEVLLEHPSARWLDALALETADDDSGLQTAIDALARAPRPNVRELTLGECGDAIEEEWDEEGNYLWRRPQADLAGLWRALPALRRLVVRGDPKRLGVLALPELECLEIHGRMIDTTAIGLASACPAVARLELRYRGQQGPEIVDRLRPLLEQPLGRRLEHLALPGLAAMDDICAVIARLRRPSLSTLDLSDGEMSDEGAETLAAAPLELDIIDVSRNRLSDRGKRALEHVAKLVIAEQQKYPPR